MPSRMQSILQDAYAAHYIILLLPSMLAAFSALTLLAGRQEEYLGPVKIEWWGAGVVIYLELGADCLHTVQLTPLPSQNPTVS